MIYIYFALLFILAALIIYFFNVSKTEKEENIFENVHTQFFDKEQLYDHAEKLSKNNSEISKENCKRRLIESLDLSYKKLLDSYEYIEGVSKDKKEILPAAEWMLDNLYLIEKEYKTIKYNMPSRYYKNLPIIKNGKMKGYPRVYHIAVELISHTDGMIDKEIIEGFIEAYQKNTVLTMGELWALPLMLRIALIQDISSIANKIKFTQKEKNYATLVSDKIIEAYGNNRLEEEFKNLSEEGIKLTTPFIERFFKILRDNDLDNERVYLWVEKKFNIDHKNIEEAINYEHVMESKFQLSMGNSITSLRAVDAINWPDSFEALSEVEKLLKEDPAKVYESMDFSSRDYYRHKIEELSRKIGIDEEILAEKIIALSKNNIGTEEKFKSHVGYYIIDEGSQDIKKEFKYRDRGLDSILNSINKKAVRFYASIITLGVLLLEALIIGISIYKGGVNSIPVYILGAIALLIPCSEIVISIFNWSINRLVSPRFVPKLELKDGIPEELSTMAVIPTLLGSEKRVKDLMGDLEVYYLSNSEKNLYFAILGDFKDSDKQTEKGDKDIIDCALREVKKLNSKYAKDGEDIFYFFNRYRQYNEKQGIWLGWERKRGKLMEFNSLLRGEKNTSYDVISGDISKLSKIKYVITLDADTELPRDGAKKLIGALAHILNKGHVDKEEKRVVRGYGLMQPRVTVGIIAANKTLFSKIFSGETGIDTYSTAVSDVYQDLFGEGIFTGKGIYDVDIFETMLKDEIPENAVLSHDLLEGSYVRCALLTDVELVDGYPAYYNSSSLRLHRWVRGDWQLIPWLFKESPLNRLSKWKIIDNLRRSLLTPSIVILIILAFTVLPNGYEQWIVVAYLSIIVPILFDVSENVVAPIKGISLSGKISNAKMVIEQVFLIFAFIPYQAYMMVDAILRTLYRLYVSKRNLLEWQTAADVEAKSGKKLENYLQSMWIGSGIALFVAFVAFNYSIDAGYNMIPSVVIWLLSPFIAYYISKENMEEEVVIAEEDINIIRSLSRRIWAYFEDFVDEEHNWLAPDNYQEEPDKGVAPRTSPTNIGMGLVSNINAYDLGYIGIEQTVDRIEKILDSIENLEKYKGHLYNWYDTKTAEPLYPRYVSTVDSGNLVGYLWLIAESLREYTKNPLINSNFKEGLIYGINAAREEVGTEWFNDELNDLKSDEVDLEKYKKLLMDIRSGCIEIEKNHEDELYWISKLKAMTSMRLKELQNLMPWADTVICTRYLHYEELKEVVMKEPLDNLVTAINDIRSDIVYGKSEIESLIENSLKQINRLLNRIKLLISRCNDLVRNTDFKMLYDKDRELFAIGYDIERDTLGNCYYDLLASEARAASYIAIAKGDVKQDHWFKLGRSITYMDGRKGLVSWSGTMFEYLMPLLIMKNYPDTLLDHTYKAVVDGQKKYAEERKVPWGISESAFYHFDVALNYQYKAFGVPGIGLKRGLVDELVVAPYASVMALMVDFRGSLNNIKRFIRDGVLGKYGLYEAIDYTKDRIPKGKKCALVKCFMVHHEGMSLMALDNILNSNVLQRRFHNIPEVKSTELLLQEKAPKTVVYDREHKFNVPEGNKEKQPIIVRAYDSANTEYPELQLLSNGVYSMMITNSGNSYGKKEDMMLYRWREDATTDGGGVFFYIKNINSNEYWSATYEPCKSEGENYQVTFSLDKAEFIRKDGNISTKTEITVSNEDNAEIRRMTLTNHSSNVRIVEVTSYLEVTLAPYNADIVHPTFSNLFINTEYMDNPCCLIANRRPRAKGQKKPHMMQTVIVEGETVGSVQYETSRINFIGRSRSVSNPQVMDNEAPLQNTVGAVLDPIISLRRRVRIKPGESARISFTTGVADSKEEVIELARKYREIKNINRAFEGAYTQSQVELNYLGIKSTQANLYQLIASRILFINPSIKDREVYIKDIKKYQKDLWAYGISGDLPMLLLILREDKDVDLARQVLNAHEYLTMKGLKFDLVLLNMEEASYDQPLQQSIVELINSTAARNKQNKQGGIFLHNRATMQEEVINLLLGIARLVLDSSKGSLTNQINIEENAETGEDIKESSEEIDKQAVSYIRNSNFEGNVYKEAKKQLVYKGKKKWNRELEGIGALKWVNSSYSLELGSEISEAYISKERTSKLNSYAYDVSNLLYFNGIGGFNKENNSYMIVLRDFKNTPAPWINVISNKDFGFHISESGSAYTWSGNSRENKITPWNNDPVIDEMGEALFLRDEENGHIWSISPKPVRDEGEYVIEHGFGYSRFTHDHENIVGSMEVFVDVEEPIKYSIITLKNNSSRDRKICLSYYARMVMGVVPEQTAQYVYTQVEKDFIWARNPYSEHFGKLHGFLGIVGGEENSFTGNRREFIGRGGSIIYPLAMRRENLSNSSGAGFDPCLAQFSKIDIKAGEEKTLAIIFGQHEDLSYIKETLEKFKDINLIKNKLNEAKTYWSDLLGTIKVETPDKSMDMLLNGWLMYQTIACRYWSRTAFYQSGGAYGFRDQLQDSMSIGFLKATVTREQILRSASRQYIEGDVQHWWHPVVNSGIRTRFSDDLLWLPYVTADYIKNTGDFGILEEEVNYLEDEPLAEGEDERYNVVGESDKKGTIYEHCIKAIDKALKFGPHNIPLMGSGDWNDGMSTVGNKGRGESVWLGWFLYNILDNFIELCVYKDDVEKKTQFEKMKEYIRENIEENAWDGGWYRRAYFDDGTPLGSIENDECQIDSLSQSWSIISGAGEPKRSEEAMQAVERYLIKEDKGMILLLAPPFNNSKLEPGYIKGYVPGVRENGGQYTHAAIWVILAMAKLGYGDRAWQLFNMINPINHSNSPLETEVYKVEPYVMTADIYAREPHGGRGGWSWYTGASGWMYRVGIEAILGLKFVEGKGFKVEPCVPSYWKEYKMTYKKNNSIYNIHVVKGENKGIKVNGQLLQGDIIPFGQEENYDIEVTI